MSKKTIYYWEQKVTDVTKTKIEDIEVNNITLENWKSVSLTDAQLGYLITKEPKDLSQMRDLMLDAIIPELLDIFQKHNLKKDDMQAVLNSLVWTFNNRVHTAIWKALGTYEDWKHPETFIWNISFLDILKFKS